MGPCLQEEDLDEEQEFDAHRELRLPVPGEVVVVEGTAVEVVAVDVDRTLFASSGLADLGLAKLGLVRPFQA